MLQVGNSIETVLWIGLPSFLLCFFELLAPEQCVWCYLLLPVVVVLLRLVLVGLKCSLVN